MVKELATADLFLSFLVVVFGASGTYLLLPHRFGSAKPRSVHIAGGAISAVAILAFVLFWKPPGAFLASLFFYAFSLSAVVGALLTIVSRSPIHSALWFASVILSTSGLFLLAGAQFLAAGTVIVYAGAIIVTFLFVIMLAQVEGQAAYDRAARSPGRATFSCYLLLWGLLYTLLSFRTVPAETKGVVSNAQVRRLVPQDRILSVYSIAPNRPAAYLLKHAVRETSKLNDAVGLPKPHVAGLGESLYTENLIAIEVAGTLLFVALIGALAIATPKPPIRPELRGGAPSATN